MRFVFAFGLLVSMIGIAGGSEGSIPQDVGRMEQHRKDWLEWNRRTLQGAYDRVGRKDPKWDIQVARAFELAARIFSRQVDPAVLPDEVRQSARAAMASGSDDPMLIYLTVGISVAAEGPKDEGASRRLQALAKSLAASQYPPCRRAVAIRKAGTALLALGDEPSKAEARANFDAVLALLPQSVKLDERTEFWENLWIDHLLEVVKGLRDLGSAAEVAYRRVDEVLSKSPELAVLRLKVRAEFWRHYGWEARTRATAPNVPAGGFEKLEERSTLARTAAEKAWKLRPGDGRTARILLEIDKSIGGDRNAMERSFARAMEANGDDRAACWSKLDWLDPKWHGTADEMLDFGRQCRDTKNWRAGITLLCADAHYRYALETTNEDLARHLAKPAVMADIVSVYREYLEHFPNDYLNRSKYATILYAARRYAEAHAQFEILGDHLTGWTESPRATVGTLKTYRDFCAKVIRSTTGLKQP